MIALATVQFMGREVGGLRGTMHGEKRAEQLVQRNEYRTRDWQTRACRNQSAHPQVAQGQLTSWPFCTRSDRKEGAKIADP